MSSLVNGLYPRAIDRFVQDQLLPEFSALMVVGPRGSGKSTSMQAFADTILDLSQPGDRRAVLDDPDGVVGRAAGTVLIDEWQEAPDVLGAVKRLVDADRENTPARFIITGSVRAANNEKTWPGTGRLVRVHMFGLTQAELALNDSYNPIDAFFAVGSHEFQPSTVTRDDYLERIVAGRFPMLVGKKPRTRSTFFRSYIEQLLSRDAPQIADRNPNQGNLKAVLLSCAARTGKELKKEATIKDAGISNVAANSYLAILEGLSIIVRVPAWDTNRIKRLTKSPKVHIVDPGMAAHLLNVDAATIGANPDLVGAFFETFVATELVTHCVTAEIETTVSHLRTRDQQEVDIVLERPGAVVGLEVKSATSVNHNDVKGLRWLKTRLGNTFKFGAVLYAGKLPYQIEDNIWALPISSLWKPPAK